MIHLLNLLWDALWSASEMFWEVLWPLILGFALSGAVQAVVSHRSMARLLGNDSPRSLSLATLFGVASSSCSYAAVALARSIFQKGASFTAAMVFELDSTNLVIELGIILIVLMGWSFAAAVRIPIMSIRRTQRSRETSVRAASAAVGSASSGASSVSTTGARSPPN